MGLRTLAAVGAALAIVTGIAAASLWRELRPEGESIVPPRAQAAAAGSPSQSQRLLSPDFDVDAHGTLRATAEQSVADASATAAPAPSSNDSSYQRDGRGSGFSGNEDPAQREARLAELRAGIEQTYPGLVEELRLTPAEADGLFGLLAENQLVLEAGLEMASDQLADIEAAARSIRERQVLQRQQRDALRDLLGNARYAQWQTYQQTQSSRLQASSHARALAREGVPLTERQTRTIATAMTDEQESLKHDIVAIGRTVTPGYPQTQLQAQEALRRRREESSQRVLEAVSPYLSTQQMNVLRKQVEQQDAVDRAAERQRTAN